MDIDNYIYRCIILYKTKTISIMSTLTANPKSFSKKNEQWLKKTGILYADHQQRLLTSLETIETVQNHVTVSGFPVTIADKNEAIRIRKNIAWEAEESKKIKEELNKAGIQPIAILPEDIFNKIIKKAGFYSFYRIQPDGRVYGNGQYLYKNYNFVDNNFLLAIVLSLLSMALPILLTIWGGINKIPLAYGVGGGILGIQIILLWMVCVQNHNNEPLQKWQRKVLSVFFTVLVPVRNSYYCKQKANIKSYLWPRKNDVNLALDDDEEEDLFTLELPQPPERVVTLLGKCYANEIKTFMTLHPSAFGVMYDEETVERLRIKYSDPVICTKHKSLIVVLDQFGDFPEEKEVVEYIAQHFNAIRSDLFPQQVN